MTGSQTRGRVLLPGLLRWLVALDLLVAAASFAGGAALIARPDGGLLALPLAVLEHSPFATFLVPGLFLFFVVGGTAFVAGAAHLFRVGTAGQLSLLAGVTLVVWTVVQMTMIRDVHWLHATYLAVGFAQIALVLRALRRAART